MITQYFDINQRLIIQSPGTLAPATLQPWVYGDNYNLIVYLVGNGVYQPIGANDSLLVMLFQPVATLPENNLAIVSTPVVKTDPAGYNYYQINVNLATSQLASLVQSGNQPAKCNFHYIFTPGSGERFSSSADVAVTVNPDPSQGATGGTPAPPGYPSNPNVFEQIANKNAVGGYVGLDGTGHLNPAQIPTDTTLQVVSGKLSAVGGTGGSGNPYIAVIPASFTIPAENATVAVSLGTAFPDLVSNQAILITDGTSSLNATIVSVSGTALTIRNSGGGAVSGTMGANSHVYMGNRAGLVDTSISGLVPALPTTNPIKAFFRGDGTYGQANYPDLTNVPGTFTPSAHANTHLSTGGDPIALATISAAGLCPPPDGSTIVVSGGKLVAVSGGGGGNAFVATIPASFTIPAAGASVTLTMDAAHPDPTIGTAVAITDGSHILNGIVTSNSSTTLIVKNPGSVNGAVSGTMGAGAHVYMGNTGDLATTAAPGIVRPDGTTIAIASGVLSTIGSGLNVNGKIHATVAQTLSATTNTPLAVVHSTVDFQNGGTFWSSSNPSQLAIPQTGIYICGGQVTFGASATGSRREVYIRQTGATVIAGATTVPGGVGGTWFPYICVQGIAHFTGGTDYLELMFVADAASLPNVVPSNGGPCLWAARIA